MNNISTWHQRKSISPGDFPYKRLQEQIYLALDSIAIVQSSLKCAGEENKASITLVGTEQMVSHLSTRSAANLNEREGNAPSTCRIAQIRGAIPFSAVLISAASLAHKSVLLLGM